MSHIHGMAILGIRSFSPEEPSYIKFFSPLTLIVGPNGSGKTTIIESLRYACTGDLPPNSKGGAFVNDPKMAGYNEVKAQIKLKFFNINGQKMICSRSLAVTQKKSTISQKTIDNALLRYDPVSGEAYSITSRCADMDAELPLHLGVPKAILDNVIFCHQEDSNWPLSESSVLKKRFDEIFSSKKYAAAIDNIKDIRKEAAQEIRIGNVTLEALKSDTLKAKKVRTTLTEINQQLAAKNETLQTIEAKIEQAEQETSRINEILREIGSLEDEMQQLRNKKEFYESTMQSLESHIVPRDETTEELNELLHEHRIKEDVNQNEKAQVTREKAKLERKLKAVQEELSRKHIVMGRMEAERENYNRQVKACAELIGNMNETKQLSLPVDDGAASLRAMKKLLEETAKANEEMKNEAMDSQNVLSDQLQLLKSRKMSIEENMKHLLNLIKQDDLQIDGINRKIKGFHVSEVEIQAIQGKIKEYQEKIKAVDAESNGASQESIKKKQQELRQLDETISELNDEFRRLGKEGEARAQLSVKRKDKERKQTTMDQIYNDHIEDIENLLSFRPSPENLERDLDVYKTRKEKELAALIEVRNKASRELSASEAKFNMVNQNYLTKQKEAEKYRTLIRSICGDKDLLNEIKEVEHRIEQWTNRIAQMDGALTIYKKYTTTQENSNCCPLCTRDFGTEAEINAFKAQLKEMQAFIPEKQNKLKEQLSSFESKRKKLLSAQPTWIKWEGVKKDIANIQKTLDAYSQDKEDCINKADIASTDLIEVDNCKIKADKLIMVGRHVKHLNKEVQALDQDIKEIERDLAASGSTRTQEEAQRELREYQEKSVSIRRDVERMNKDLAIVYRRKQGIEQSISESKQKLITLENHRDFKVGLDLQLEELQEQKQHHSDEYERITEDLAPLDAQVQEAARAYELAVQKWRIDEEKASSSERELSSFTERLGYLTANITKSASMGSPEKVEALKQEMASFQSSIDQTKEAIKAIDDKLAIIEKDESERRGIERDLQDQIKYRDMRVQLAKCKEDMRKLERKQGDYDISQLKSDLTRARNKESQLVDKRGSVRGEIVQMKDQINRYENELRTDYADVDARYGKMFIEVKTSELANSDLEKYSKVLQLAITKYHSLKMDDLNKIIKDLWVDTYKGGDIDYIGIRTDSDGGATSRSLNYRVVMVQNGNELNMRGRCSAGQKVLAAIIIRLALAETFCVDCGIFTLDEPTTNLDRDNIESLAENLARIIKNRRRQSNFQFVIITHDEEFVEYLSRDNILGEYYRVAKNQSQHSTITLQNAPGAMAT